MRCRLLFFWRRCAAAMKSRQNTHGPYPTLDPHGVKGTPRLDNAASEHFLQDYSHAFGNGHRRSERGEPISFIEEIDRLDSLEQPPLNAPACVICRPSVGTMCKNAHEEEFIYAL